MRDKARYRSARCSVATPGHQGLLGLAAASAAVAAATSGGASFAALRCTLAARSTLALRFTLTSRTCSSQQHIPVTNSSLELLGGGGGRPITTGSERG